jgi:ADP-dependent NAD(P)H-hydrate dehydratase / NAD(P)H-hydrate epimerase
VRALVDADRMREIDRKAERDFGLSSLVLMENAGIKAVHYLTDVAWRSGLPSGAFVITAGRGNNGGDALVMARQFFLIGKTQSCVILGNGEPSKDSPCGINLAICRALGLAVLDWRKDQNRVRAVLAESAVVIDGLAGIGLEGKIKEPVRELIDLLNAVPAFKVALDAPSGVGRTFAAGWTAVRADLTLTFGLPKDFLYFPLARPFAGKIVTIDPGFPPALMADETIPGTLLEPDDFTSLLPPLPGNAHKGIRGHLGVFAGSPGKSGAAALASLAAARSRVGLVTLYTDPAVLAALSARLVSVMACEAPDPDGTLTDLEQKHRALLIGPGFGLDRPQAELFRKLCALRVPKIIDADGLTLLAAADGDLLARGEQTVLTPHPGECARLLGTTVDRVLADPLASVQAVGARYHAVCVLKGHVTFIGGSDHRFSVVDGMNPALGTAGSGDVLAGLIGAFLTQGIEASASARLGVLLHARIGEEAFRSRGFFLAEDLLEFISPALKA